VCAKTRELVVSFSVPCTGCTLCSLPAEVNVSKFDMVELPYCAGHGTWRLSFDALHGLVRENRIMSVYGLSRTVVLHLLQAKSRLTPFRAHHKLLRVAPTFARLFIIIR